MTHTSEAQQGKEKSVDSEKQARIQELREALWNGSDPLKQSNYGFAKGEHSTDGATIYDHERSPQVIMAGQDARVNYGDPMTGEGFAGVFDGFKRERGAEVSGEPAMASFDFFADRGVPRSMVDAEDEMRAMFAHIAETVPVEQRSSTALMSRTWRDSEGRLNVTIGSIGDSVAYMVDKETGDTVRLNDIDDGPTDMLNDQVFDYFENHDMWDDEAAQSEVKRAVAIAMSDGDNFESFVAMLHEAGYGELADSVPENLYAMAFQQRNAISASLEGLHEENIDLVHVSSYKMEPGMRLVLTTDGVSDPLSHKDIGDIVGNNDPLYQVDKVLLERARAVHGVHEKDDDASVMLFEFDDEAEAQVQEILKELYALDAPVGDEHTEDAPEAHGEPEGEALDTAAAIIQQQISQLENGEGVEVQASLVENEPAPEYMSHEELVKNHLEDLIRGQSEVDGADPEMVAHVVDQVRSIELTYIEAKMEQGLEDVGVELMQTVRELLERGDTVWQLEQDIQHAGHDLAEFTDRAGRLANFLQYGGSAEELNQYRAPFVQASQALGIEGNIQRSTVNRVVSGQAFEEVVDLYRRIVEQTNEAEDRISAARGESMNPDVDAVRNSLVDIMRENGSTLDGLRSGVDQVFPERMQVKMRMRQIEEMAQHMNVVGNLIHIEQVRGYRDQDANASFQSMINTLEVVVQNMTNQYNVRLDPGEVQQLGHAAQRINEIVSYIQIAHVRMRNLMELTTKS